MEPTPSSHYTLVDLLDRVLDKGIVIHADVVISVAGVPLIGINLRAALAGMETMLRYGVMQPLDEQIRSLDREERQLRAVPHGQLGAFAGDLSTQNGRRNTGWAG